jgi:long-chain fatty acid transport protein
VPTKLGLAFNDTVSIGFGPTINRISGEITGMVPNPLSPGRNDGKLKSNGDDMALGFNAGILVQATDRTRLGLTYHSKVSCHLDAKTKVTNGISYRRPDSYQLRCRLDTRGQCHR